MRLLPDDKPPDMSRQLREQRRRDRRLMWVFFLIPLAVSLYQ
jgi:hypothetical protein